MPLLVSGVEAFAMPRKQRGDCQWGELKDQVQNDVTLNQREGSPDNKDVGWRTTHGFRSVLEMAGARDGVVEVGEDAGANEDFLSEAGRQAERERQRERQRHWF